MKRIEILLDGQNDFEVINGKLLVIFDYITGFDVKRYPKRLYAGTEFVITGRDLPIWRVSL